MFACAEEAILAIFLVFSICLKDGMPRRWQRSLHASSFLEALLSHPGFLVEFWWCLKPGARLEFSGCRVKPWWPGLFRDRIWPKFGQNQCS